MLNALLILGMIAVILLIAGIVLVTVKLSEALTKQAVVLDRAHERFKEMLDPIFDRLMAHSWEEYVTIRTTVGEDEGGFVTPEEQQDGNEEEGEIEQLVPAWGTLRPVSEVIPRPSADEEKLLAEDFDEDGDAVTDEERRYQQAKERGVV